MKAVLISIQPKWCEKIFNGSKSIEVRKSRPSLDMPFKVYVYETKGRKFNHKENKDLQQLFLRMGLEQAQGHVIGSFVCDDVITDFHGEHSDDFAKYALLSIDEQKKIRRKQTALRLAHHRTETV